MSAVNTVDLLWHYRLDHVSFAKMKGLTSIPVKFPTKQPFLSPICPMARQSRLPFSTRTTTSRKCFDLLRIDLWGPYHIKTYNHFRYFITYVDDHNRTTWTYLLSSKNNAFQVIQTFLSMIEN